ncbi:MAG TPA: PilZ domain-containing protein [Pseudobdellovibrionaceae bacterium]|nr:PilZ domain-containing protein [Pseudobdellovibrionaceae bacterium]
MASGNGNWSLNNPLKGWTLHGLTESEARLLLHTLSLAERRVVWAWKKGLESWVHLDHESCAELNAPYTARDPGAPALPATVEDEITAVHSSIRKVKRFQQRPERKSASVPAEIIQGQQTFRTRTENVSDGGIKFVDVLPDWVAGYFTVILGLAHGPVEVTCMLVEDQKDAKTRVEVVETEDEESHLPIYRDWVRQIP